MTTLLGKLGVRLEGWFVLSQPSANEIDRVRSLLAQILGRRAQDLTVRLRGRFPVDAQRPPRAGAPDRRRDWDLGVGRGTGRTYRVVWVGQRYVEVELERGLNDGKPLSVDPSLGNNVQVRIGAEEVE